MGGERLHRRGGLDRGDVDPPIAAPLQRPPGAVVGPEPSALDPVQERVELLGPHPSHRTRLGVPVRLAHRRARR